MNAWTDQIIQQITTNLLIRKNYNFRALKLYLFKRFRLIFFELIDRNKISTIQFPSNSCECKCPKAAKIWEFYGPKTHPLG